MNGKPLVIDGYCGLGGWTEGFLAEGWECVGIDIERHDYGSGGYPGHLILQDMLPVPFNWLQGLVCGASLVLRIPRMIRYINSL